MKVKNYIGYNFESACYRTEEYIAFEKSCKKELKAQCAKYGINLHKFNPSHFEWSAVLEKDGRYVYVSLNDVRYGDWYNDVLIRTMSHDKDWRGGSNNECRFDEIGEKANNLFNRTTW